MRPVYDWREALLLRAEGKDKKDAAEAKEVLDRIFAKADESEMKQFARIKQVREDERLAAEEEKS